MAKTDAGKKVAKVGKAGSGSRKRSSSGPQGNSSLFPVIMGLVVVVGLVLIVVSRDPSDAVPPALGEHWHAAYDIYLCDDFAAPLTDLPGVDHNIHTHQDNLIHIHPFSSAATGEKATIEVFEETTGFEVDSDSITLPDGTSYTNGDDCGGEPGTVQLASWMPTEFDEIGRATAWADEPTMVEGDPSDHRPQDDELMTFAFVPEGADVPQPRSAAGLAAPVDEGGAPLDLSQLGDADQREQGAADAEDDSAEDTAGDTGDEPADTSGEADPATEDDPAADDGAPSEEPAG